jgi:parvulin-like peptidyl-prolyl isomerase
MKFNLRNPFKKQTAKPEKKIIILSIVSGILLLVVAFFGIFAWGIYKLDWQGKFVESIVKIVPFPAAQVDNNYISFFDYSRNLDAANQFYAKERSLGMQNLPNTQATKKIILEDRLISNMLSEKIAINLGVTISEQDVQQKLEEIIKNGKSQEETVKYLNDWYGISLTEYEKYFIRPNLLQDKIETNLQSNTTINGEAKKKIDEAYAKLKAGGNFDEVFKQYSEFKPEDEGNASSMTGNFLRGELPKALEDALFALNVGQYTDVIKLSGSYSIIKIIKKDENKGVLTLKTIFVKTKSLNDLVQEEKNKSKITIYAY